MPRKVNYGLDYDDYDDDDYDYDYDYDVDAVGNASAVKPSTIQKVDDIQTKLWRCSICTYDNDESLPFCDICGVIRNSSVKVNNKSSEKDEGLVKKGGVSALAKSIFTPVSSEMPKTSNLYEQLNDDFLRSISKDSIPFKFDRPSPDDFVSSRNNTSKGISKATPVLPTSSDVSTSVSKYKETNKDLFSSETFHLPSKTRPKDRAFVATSENDLAFSSDKCETILSGLQISNSDKESEYQRNPASSTKVPSQYKVEKWMSNQDESQKQLNLAIVGHVDSGKSTLSGRLLHLLGYVSKKQMHKYEKEAKEKGKGSFAYAWAMDESVEERERGVTMTVAVAYFNTKKYHVVLLDSPGHKDFVPNMISGAAQADAAVLVVDASLGSFEAGMSENGAGQTREHVQLIRSFGVEQVVVLINKLDVVGYSKERYDFIKAQLGSFLRSCQFKDSCLAWIPASAMENQNIAKASSDVRLSSWYSGPCLLEAIDSLQSPERDISKPLRMPICDVISSHSLGQVAASGKLETGAIRNGSKVLVMPSREVATVRSIERDSKVCNIARAGDNVAISLHGIDANNVISGGVLCHPDFPVAVGSCLELKIYVLEIKSPILVGSQVEFLAHHVKEAARVSKILSVLDKKTKTMSKKSPRFLTAKQSAIIEVVLDRPVCVEEFSNCRPLGRAFLRALGNTIAVGTISRIIDQQVL